MKNLLPYMNEVSEKMATFFSESSIEEIARETCFVRRNSKLMGFVFCQLLLKMFTKSLPLVSLTDYKEKLKNNQGIDITEEGINQRFNEQSIGFFKALINRLLALQLNSVISSVQLDLPFKDIQLLDYSTYIKLPDCMGELFPGTGKKGGKETGNSGYKWHLEYMLFSLEDESNSIEASEYKLFNLFKLQFAENFITAIFHPKKSKLLTLLKKLYRLAKLCCKKEAKKGKQTPMIILKNINKKDNVKEVKQTKYIAKAA
ncbi:MAG: hypothetical protein R3E32_07465 [Chitinophagales bacterium]